MSNVYQLIIVKISILFCFIWATVTPCYAIENDHFQSATISKNKIGEIHYTLTAADKLAQFPGGENDNDDTGTGQINSLWVLSFLFTGMGHFAIGEIGGGLIWLIVGLSSSVLTVILSTAAGSTGAILGIIVGLGIYIFQIIDAYNAAVRQASGQNKEEEEEEISQYLKSYLIAQQKITTHTHSQNQNKPLTLISFNYQLAVF